MNALDTNILGYAYDDEQVGKQRIAIDLIDRLIADPQPTVLLWQVACEFIAALRKWQYQSGVLAADVDAYCQEALNYFPLNCPSADVISLSLRLTSKYSISHWDSLLVAAALEAGVNTLYSEDLQAGATYESLTTHQPIRVTQLALG
jgi:predicted nucleic acid-binding protein